jgi:SAM-dependent methyltransferase
MIDLSPAPFHRRRLILEITEHLQFASVLDVGCGNGALLAEFQKSSVSCLAGIDLSEFIIEENRKRFPHFRFSAVDISKDVLKERFDLVVCSEVLEHIDDFAAALGNLRAMCNRYLLITVPSGRVFPIDRKMGHVRHFSPENIMVSLENCGLKTLLLKSWGFPFHTTYKYLINFRPDSFLERFAETEYGKFETFIAKLLRLLFYLNLQTVGLQIFCLAEIEDH